MQTMYYCWEWKGMRPSDFYHAPEGEKLILRAFIENKLEEERRYSQRRPYAARR